MRLARPQIVWIAVLCAVAGGIGYLWGRASLPLTETQVIEAMAARYVAETGLPATDCSARPAEMAWAWIVVECVGAEGRFAYPANEDGRLVHVVEFGT